jgi:phage terminase large subunit-like protein
MAPRAPKGPPAKVPKKWVRTKADEQAVDAGCRFDESRGLHVVEFARQHLKLYEGECAGRPFEPMPYQVDLAMRLFGWVKWSERWNRWVRRFRQLSFFAAKKNGKTPLLSWFALYLLTADDEQGQKVYLCAKDGAQARDMAGKHAVEMVMASPALRACCTINRSTYQITHEPTRSTLKPISSADSKAQKAKEGLNGCTLVDETHVVDREFIGRISRAGISRSEPLHVEVSTAGDDPTSYGKERFDYGELINREGGNLSLLHVSYAAPQDAKDEDLLKDPARYAKQANPAWGITVDPDELLDDVKASRRSLAEWARCKMYRFNIWSNTATPWLRADDWHRGRRRFTLADMEGRRCWAGLDLSKVRDLTALVLYFPWLDGEARGGRLWPLFFMPEETARERNDRVPFLQWARDGHLALTPGSTVDYGFVRRRFQEVAARHDVRELLFDPWQAEQTTQEMEEGVVVEGETLEEGTGVPRFEFRQTMENYAGPTDELEKMVLDGTLWHPGNPVLDWQAGHVQVYTNANGNKRPVKQKHGDIKSIDGVVAAIMSIAHAEKATEGPSVYEKGGLRFV